MSATGKSTVLGLLADAGCRVVDTDDGDWIRPVGADGEPLWEEGRMRGLLGEERSDHLFVAGCVANQADFYDAFDAIVLLTAPLDVLRARVAVRSNPFGRTQQEWERIAADVRAVEPVLARSADLVVDTRAPVDDVVAALLALASSIRH